MGREARVLLLSQRGFNFQHWMPWVYEFEDVIRAVDAVHLLTPPTLVQTPLAREWQRVKNGILLRLGRLTDPGIPEIELEASYDLFFCILNWPAEAAMLSRLRNLHRRCYRKVAVIVEAWSEQIAANRAELQLLSELGFDVVYLTHRSGLSELSAVSGCPSSLFLFGVDALRFAPFPRPPARVVDCYSMGRRSEVTHQALLELVSRGDFFYLYDTIDKRGDFFQFQVSDWLQHRNLTANIIKRSRYFIAYAARYRSDRRLAPDESVSPRFYEGCAGGAILLGIAPRCREFTESFDWPDALVEIPYECRDIGSRIEDLDRQKERLASARRANVTGCLRRHDWAFRWKEILDRVGLVPLEGWTARVEELRQVASEIEQWPPEYLEAGLHRDLAGCRD